MELYANGKVKFNIIWATRKIKSLFKIKDKVKHLSCVNIKEFVVVVIITYVKPSETQLLEEMKTNKQTVNPNLLNT